jgi:hypothetical protein
VCHFVDGLNHRQEQHPFSRTVGLGSKKRQNKERIVWSGVP